MTKELIEEARHRAAIGADVDPIDAARLLNELADELESQLALATARDAVAGAAKLSHGFLVIEREEHEDTRQRAERAETAIERVRTVHRKETRLNNWTVCTHCAVGMLQDPVDWPCDTIAALDGGVSGE